MGTPSTESEQEAAHRWEAHPLWLLLPLATAVYALGFSWGRWGDPVVDWGRELEVARRLAGGDLLYADVHYWYGPLAPYVNAALFGAFGADTRILQMAGLVSLVLMAALLWTLATFLAGRLAAATVTAAFVGLCGFGHYYLSDIFNWVTPYAYPATYGMLLATASLLALLRAAATDSTGAIRLAQGLLALACLTKLEPAFACAAAHLAFVATASRHPAERWRGLIGGYVVVIATVTLVLAAFALGRDPGDHRANMLSQLDATNAGPILQYMGLANWRVALPALGGSALRLATCAVAPLAAARVARNLGPAAVATGAAVAATIAWATFRDVPPEHALLALPLVAVLGLLDAAARLRRAPATGARCDLVLWAFSLAAMARLPLAAGAHHYGFYLLPMPLAATVLLWFRRLPRLAGGTDAARTICAATALGMVATLAWTHLAASRAMYARHTAHVVGPRGDLWLLGDAGALDVGALYGSLVDRLRDQPPTSRVFAAPEGAGLVFVAGLATWGRDFSYYPPEVAATGDARLRAALEADPPDALAVLNFLDLSAYGHQGFGRDYATETIAWLEGRYAVAWVAPGDTAFIALPRVGTGDAS